MAAVMRACSRGMSIASSPRTTCASLPCTTCAVAGSEYVQPTPVRPPAADSTSTIVVRSHSRVPSDSGASVGMVNTETRTSVTGTDDEGCMPRYSPFGPVLGDRPGNICSTACTMKPARFGSPATIDDVNSFACSSVMCGGSGGTSGSTYAS